MASSSSAATVACRASSFPPSSSSHPLGRITYLGAKASYDYDMELMSIFSTEQLMELAGLAVAQVAQHHYVDLNGLGGRGSPPPASSAVQQRHQQRRFVVCCGPGNNGGDGLVAARHLKQFGHDVSVVYPRRTDKALYHALVKQAELCDVPFYTTAEEALGGAAKSKCSTAANCETAESMPSTVVIDAIFGYSFKPSATEGVREPFRSMIRYLNTLKAKGLIETVAVDVPSGWDVDHGKPTASNAATPSPMDSSSAASLVAALDAPNVLISLMTPKDGVRTGLAAAEDGARHYLGGRFVPPRFAEERGMVIPFYPGGQQWVDITGCEPL